MQQEEDQLGEADDQRYWTPAPVRMRRGLRLCLRGC